MRKINLFCWSLMWMTGLVHGDSTDELALPKSTTVTLAASDTQLKFTWQDVSGETEYRLLEDVDGHSGYQQVATLPADSDHYELDVVLSQRMNARYVVQACNDMGCSYSIAVGIPNEQAHLTDFKAVTVPPRVQNKSTESQGYTGRKLLESTEQKNSPADNAVGELLQQQERRRGLKQQEDLAPDVRLPRAVTQQDMEHVLLEESPCFVIQKVELIGEAAGKFQWVLKNVDVPDQYSDYALIGRCLGTTGINLLMRRVQNALIKRGYVTSRVLAQPQNLKSGTLQLTLVPGRLSAMRRAEGTSTHATLWNAIPISKGDILNLRDIEQALENFKRVPTVEADLQIAPAEGTDAKPGESDLLLSWEQGFPLRFTLTADDSGTKSTGKYQGSATVSYDHALMLNDLFYATFTHDQGGGDPGDRGSSGNVVHYSLPYGYWMLGFTVSNNRYHQSVAGASQSFLYSGDSHNREVKLSRLVYRNAVRKTTLSLRGSINSSHNFIDDVEIENQRRRMTGWDLGVGHREFFGQNTLDLNLNYHSGTGASNAPATTTVAGADSSRSQFTVLDAQLNAPFALGQQRMRYSGTLRSQWNHSPLVPKDRFSIGGRYTVRGFDGENILSAEKGWLIRNDLGWALWQTGQELYLGLDTGAVSGPSSRELVGSHLSGGVLGLRGGYKSLGYDLFYGQPLDKPKDFVTASSAFGFNVSWTLSF